jgi:hypothetical protein
MHKLLALAILAIGAFTMCEANADCSQDKDWKQTEPGTIQFGRQTITYDEREDRFVWRENGVEKKSFKYLFDAKTVARGRQLELIKIGIEPPQNPNLKQGSETCRPKHR